MCDYSLCGLPNRLAVEGEDLEVHKFSTGSVGLRSPFDHSTQIEQCVDDSIWNSVKRFFGLGIPQLAEAKPAGLETMVCVPPGADLIVKGIPTYLQHRYGVEEDEGVKFVQRSAEVNSYRDAVQFENGRTIGVQDLPDGLRIEVLSLARVFAMDTKDLAGPSAAIRDRNVANRA